MIIDIVVPVSFKLDRQKPKRITADEYERLNDEARRYVTGSGNTAAEHRIVHTDAGYISVYKAENDKAFATWIADEFTVKAVVVDRDGNYFADIAAGERVLRFPFETLLPTKIVQTFYGKGIAASKVDRAHEALALHLQWLLGQFEVQDAKLILGWRQLNDQLVWYGVNTEPPRLQYKLTLPSQEAYIAELNMLIQDCFHLQYALCTAAGSTVLAYLRIMCSLVLNSFGLSLVGTSSTGKTTALQLAASMYSSPEDEAVCSGFFGTQNALVHLLSRHCGVPVCYDESTIENRGVSKMNFVYSFSQGADKLRLTQQSQLKERETWLCTALFSSETHIVDLAENDNLGLAVRILNLENAKYTRNAAHADAIKSFAADNHGVIGEMLSDYLLNADQDKIFDQYQAIQNKLASLPGLQPSGLTDRLVQEFAVILLTADILAELGVRIAVEEMYEICLEINNQIAANADPARNVVTKLFALISSKYRQAQGIRWSTDRNGTIQTVAIVETLFETLLREAGISDIKRAITYLDRDGLLIRQSKNRVKSKLVIDGVACYSYQLDVQQVNEIAFGLIPDKPVSTEVQDWLEEDGEELGNETADNLDYGFKNAVAGRAARLL